MDLAWCRLAAALLCLVAVASPFNLDTKSAVVHRGDPGAMFGFSVALYKDSASSWVLVGAPRAQTNQPNVTSGGAVYKCGTDPTMGCTEIRFDLTGSTQRIGLNRREYTDDKSNQWFGATVSTSGENGVVVACAPRYVYFSVNVQRREPVGTCWIATDSLAAFEEYSPCRTSSWGFHRQGYCQAGMSAALTEDGKMLYVGAVGSWYWQGQVFSRDLATSVEHRTSESPATYDDSFLGYSSAVGEFSGDSDPDVVVGMPRGANLTGKVVLLNSTLHNLRNISGEQLGSYFGYAVCVSDVNGDGLDDIVVGAPFYMNLLSKESKYEEGRVYVFHQDQKHDFPSFQTLDGDFPKGRFGLSLSSLKDIDRDGYQDFAVGAPYAGNEGRGLLYVYHGSPTGIRAEPSQVISPEDFKDQGLNTLGFAVSGGLDMDSNEYPDIVIGAYDSDRVVFMRSRAVVKMSSSMKLSKKVINLEEKTCTLKDRTKEDMVKVACLEATFCLNYNGIGVPPEVDIAYTFLLDSGLKSSRAMFAATHQSQTAHTIRLRKGIKYCNTSGLYIQNGIRDKLTPIDVKAEYRLLDLEPYRHVLKPILNMNEPRVAAKQLHIEKNCGKDEVCIPDLQLVVVSNMDQYSIGNKKRLELDVTIRNAGEDAFESMFYASMPLDVHYVNIDKSKLDFPVSCSGAQPELTGVNELQCDVGNPLPANKTLNFKILLEPSRVVSSITDIIFAMEVNSSNAEKNETLFNNVFEIELPVRVEVSLAVRGVSLPQVITYNKSENVPETKVRETDIGPEVTHVYEVGNQGPSSVKQAEVFILWPSYTLDNEPLLYLMAQPDVRGDAQCTAVQDVNPLQLQEIRRRPRNRLNETESLPLIYSFVHRENGSDVGFRRGSRDAVEEFMSDEGEDRFLSDEGEGTFDDELSCGATLCSLIQCSVFNLEKGEQVIFTIRSRLWRETYNEFGLREVKTSSKLVTRITALPYGVDPGYLPYKVFVVSTLVNLEDVGLAPYVVPWWIIVLAICCGLLLLALLALLLWKLGFFKRKRPEEQPEKEPLNERNGYRLARGDAAL